LPNTWKLSSGELLDPSVAAVTDDALKHLDRNACFILVPKEKLHLVVKAMRWEALQHFGKHDASEAVKQIVYDVYQRLYGGSMVFDAADGKEVYGIDLTKLEQQYKGAILIAVVRHKTRGITPAYGKHAMQPDQLSAIEINAMRGRDTLPAVWEAIFSSCTVRVLHVQLGRIVSIIVTGRPDFLHKEVCAVWYSHINMRKEDPPPRMTDGMKFIRTRTRKDMMDAPPFRFDLNDYQLALDGADCSAICLLVFTFFVHSSLAGAHMMCPESGSSVCIDSCCQFLSKGSQPRDWLGCGYFPCPCCEIVSCTTMDSLLHHVAVAEEDDNDPQHANARAALQARMIEPRRGSQHQCWWKDCPFFIGGTFLTQKEDRKRHIRCHERAAAADAARREHHAKDWKLAIGGLLDTAMFPSAVFQCHAAETPSHRRLHSIRGRRFAPGRGRRFTPRRGRRFAHHGHRHTSPIVSIPHASGR
jgi:hypothetical protein